MKLSSSYDQMTWTEAERREHTERLRAMLEDDGDTWDLSDNDKAALTMALSAVMLASKSICSYCGHVGVVRHLSSYDRLLAFVKQVASAELCEDTRKTLECYLDSGPCCGAHDWQTDPDLVREARALLADVEAAKSVGNASVSGETQTADPQDSQKS